MFQLFEIARIKSWASLFMCWTASRAERDSACLSTHEDSVMILQHVLARIASWACIGVCFHDSRAWYASASFGAYQELSMYEHEFAHVESWAYTCIGWCVFKAVLVSWYVVMYWGLCVCVQVYASAEDLAPISMCLGWSCHVSSCVCKRQGM